MKRMISVSLAVLSLTVTHMRSATTDFPERVTAAEAPVVSEKSSTLKTVVAKDESAAEPASTGPLAPVATPVQAAIAEHTLSPEHSIVPVQPMVPAAAPAPVVQGQEPVAERGPGVQRIDGASGSPFVQAPREVGPAQVIQRAAAPAAPGAKPMEQEKVLTKPKEIMNEEKLGFVKNAEKKEPTLHELAIKKNEPAKREAPQKEQQPKSAEKLDTLDIEEGGNWLIKRQVFEETFKLIDEMDQVNTKVRDMRMAFFKSRNDIDKEVALFVKDIGYSLGKLDQLATTLLDKMEHERAKEGDLSDEGRSVVLSVENIEEKVKQIQDLVQEIMSLDDKIDTEILKSLEDRINESASYRQQAWKNLQAIKKMLSDEKAQNLYNKTNGLYDTMKNVLSWLQTKLLPYFNQTVQTIKRDMTTIKSSLAELQAKGIDLQKEVDKLERDEETIDRERIEQEIEDAVEQATGHGSCQSNGFFGQVKAFIWYPVQLAQNLCAWIASFFGAKETPTHEELHTKMDPKSR